MPKGSAATSERSNSGQGAIFRMASAGALFGTVYVTATAAMQDDMAAVLKSEAYQLAEIHRQSGLIGLAQQITKRMNFRTRGPIYYLLQGPTQQVIVGNLPGMPPVNGVIDFVPDRASEAPVDPGSKLIGFGLTLSDVVLHPITLHRRSERPEAHVTGVRRVAERKRSGDGSRLLGHGAGEVGEPTADLGDHEVADAEADVAVAGIDGPGAGGECVEIRHWVWCLLCSTRRGVPGPTVVGTAVVCGRKQSSRRCL